MHQEPYPEAARAIELQPFGQRWTPDYDTKVLCWLMDQVQGDILEIGCNNGTTTRELALRYPERQIIALDYVSMQPTMVKDQHYEIPWDEFGRHATGLRNVELRNENSRLLDYSRFPGVRAVFIDGDHSYYGVKADTDLALAAFEGKDREVPYAGARLIVWHDASPNTPAWCQVWQYLEAEVAPNYPGLTHIENSSVAFLILP